MIAMYEPYPPRQPTFLEVRGRPIPSSGHIKKIVGSRVRLFLPRFEVKTAKKMTIPLCFVAQKNLLVTSDLVLLSCPDTCAERSLRIALFPENKGYLYGRKHGKGV